MKATKGYGYEVILSEKDKICATLPDGGIRCITLDITVI
jgi:hypothetical protein